MSVSVNIYSKIKEASFKVPGVRTFALWNNQIDRVKEGQTNSIAFPAIFITFENQYQNISSGNQQINGIFVLYIAMQSLKFTDEQILTYKDAVYGTMLKELPKLGFQNLTRDFEIQDTNFDNVMIYQQEYSYTFIDNTVNDQTTGTSVFPWSFDFELESGDLGDT